jgi:hypothetical protein
MEDTDYWWVDLNKMSEAYLPHLERFLFLAHRAVLLVFFCRGVIINSIGDLDFISFIAGQTCRPGVRS